MAYELRQFYGLRTSPLMPYEPFLLGVGVVFNLLKPNRKSAQDGPAPNWKRKPEPSEPLFQGPKRGTGTAGSWNRRQETGTGTLRFCETSTQVPSIMRSLTS